MTTKTRKVANIGNDIIETSSGGGITGFRNAIINGNFDFWQRGTSITTSGAGQVFVADRWLQSYTGTTNVISQQAFTLGQGVVPNEPTYFIRNVVSSVAGAGNYSQVVQRIEDVRTFVGQTVTLSFWAKADSNKSLSAAFFQYMGTGGTPSANVGGIGPTKFNLTSSWQKFTSTVSIPSISGAVLGTNNNHALQLEFWFDAGSNWNSRTNSLGQQSGTFDIAQVQVEPGRTSTPFEKRPFQQELKLCQRYYEKSYDLTVNPGTAGNANGEIANYFDYATLAQHLSLCLIRFTVPKRAIPTMTYYSVVSGASGVFYDAHPAADCAVSASVGMTGGYAYITQPSNYYHTDVVGHFVADAEI